MSNRIANPFPAVEWAQDAYQNAAYMAATMGYQWNGDTAEMTIQPRAWHCAPPLNGSPGDVMSTDVVKEDIGRIHEEPDRLNLVWLLGYMQCQLDATAKNAAVPGQSDAESIKELKGAEKDK